MTYNEEIEQELKNSGITGGKRVKAKEEDKLTPEDLRRLESRIRLCCVENEYILAQSMINAQKSILL
ncbi:MAG: hypothetical protein U0L98_04110 [Clostridia bacterium]|nr:hypothetical protein [Clostridia bacterium]